MPTDPDAGAQHIHAGQAGTGYAQRPATSGQHWSNPETPVGVPAPARWGVYDFPIRDEVLVHNLEHGGIGIHYNCSEPCDELVEQLKDLIPLNPSQFILSPYPMMESKIAITAWRHHMFLSEFDEELIQLFIETYQDQAPESVRRNLY